MACRRGFCRARISAQECPDYSTMTERAFHEKVWCSCCTQGLGNDMTALSFLSNCNCWNCHILFQTSYFFYSLNLRISAGNQVWQQIWRVCSKEADWFWSDVWDGAQCSGWYLQEKQKWWSCDVSGWWSERSPSKMTAKCYFTGRLNASHLR